MRWLLTLLVVWMPSWFRDYRAALREAPAVSEAWTQDRLRRRLE
jgi:hypothetical protein